MEALFFYLLGGLAVLGAVAFVTRREAVPAAFWLIFCFMNVAALFALLSAHLLAVLQILLYAGAIMVFFVFVIMLLGPAPRLSRPAAWPLSLLGLATLAAAAMLLIRQVRRAPVAPSPAPPEGFGGVAAVSDRLLTQYLFGFEVTGLLLLVAVIGAVFLARRDQPPAKPRARRVKAAAPIVAAPTGHAPADHGNGHGAHGDAHHDAAAAAHEEVGHV